MKALTLSLHPSSFIPHPSMTYQVIARKWRPQTFDEVTGQEPITRTLRNAIEHQRLHHAYLFSGARGVGKTTPARLLAKALNCHKSAGPTAPRPVLRAARSLSAARLTCRRSTPLRTRELITCANRLSDRLALLRRATAT